MNSKPKFRVGQVVAVRCNKAYADRPFYGRIHAKRNYEGRYEVLFWDADDGNYWKWDYVEIDLRPLTKRERGQP